MADHPQSDDDRTSSVSDHESEIPTGRIAWLYESRQSRTARRKTPGKSSRCENACPLTNPTNRRAHLPESCVSPGPRRTAHRRTESALHVPERLLPSTEGPRTAAIPLPVLSADRYSCRI